MAERLADKDGLPGSKQCLATYNEWAKGGWGLIISGNVHIDPAHPGAPGDFTVNRDVPREKTLAAWKSWASACSLNGTKSIVQINHPGRQAPFVKSLAPSPIPLDLGKGLFPWLVRSLVYGTPKEMTQADIDDVVTRFAEAAKLSVEAGFAGVEIHAAHGYLLAQFLSPLSNERTDDYGGSPIARAKIVVDVVKAVRKAVPAGACVGIKVNSTDHTDLGDFITQLKAIVDAGVDFVEVSGGSIEDPMFSTGLHTAVKASTKAREAFFIDFANAIRSELPDVPIMLTGGFRTRQGMEAAVKGGSCDLVGLARPSVIDPALPKKVLDTSIPEYGALAYAKRIEAWSWAKYTGIKAVGMGAETYARNPASYETIQPQSIAYFTAKKQVCPYRTNATIMEDSNAIVIVGAGCIGLCTAYQLSKSLGSQGRKPSIIVVDASDGPFAAASSASTLRGAAASFRHCQTLPSQLL
ncbi:hypothetical protein V3481_006284 [Fusarium oxysporum f. sp. vasinfectum]